MDELLYLQEASTIKTYFADEVGQFSEEAFKGHILGQDAAHLGKEPSSGVNVAHCAMVALGGDYDENFCFHSLPDSIHQDLVVNW